MANATQPIDVVIDEVLKNRGRVVVNCCILRYNMNSMSNHEQEPGLEFVTELTAGQRAAGFYADAVAFLHGHAEEHGVDSVLSPEQIALAEAGANPEDAPFVTEVYYAPSDDILPNERQLGERPTQLF
jgi:hypothetical protein